MSDLRELQRMAGIDVPLFESPKMYLYLVVDPTTGEFVEHGRGSIEMIIRSLEVDSENSRLADVIKQQSFGNMQQNGGKISFMYDDHIHMFVPA